MTLRLAFLKIALLGLVSAGLAGCVLDESEKTSCESQSDCLDGYSCTSDNVCEPTISLNPDAEAGFPDAAEYDPDAHARLPDAAVDDIDGGSGGFPDAAVDIDGGSGGFPDAGGDIDGGSGGFPDAAVDIDGGSGGFPDAAP